jgi:hypothetical protein
LDTELDWRCKKILELIKASADGLVENEIIEKSGFSKNTVISHLKELEREGCIRSNVILKSGRHILKFVSNISLPQPETPPWKLAHELIHAQVDIRDRETEKVLHIYWYDKEYSISDKPLTEIWGEVGSTEAQSWESQNLIIEIRQEAVTKRFDKENKPRFGEGTNPYLSKFYMDLPKTLHRGDKITETRSYDDRDIEPYFVITDLPPTEKLVFDLIKIRSNAERLDCMICPRGVERGEYSSQSAHRRMVTDLRSRRKVYALRLVLNNPERGRDYKYQYQN